MLTSQTQKNRYITFLTNCDRVSNTLQHKVQKDILWWVSKSKQMFLHKLPTNTINSASRTHLQSFTDLFKSSRWLLFVTPSALERYPTFAFTSQSDVH